MSGKLLRSVCPACGAPVSRIDRWHGFICPYCGTEFYSEDKQDIIDYSPPLTTKDTPSKAENNENPPIKRSANKFWVYLVIVGFILFFISSPDWFFSTNQSTNPDYLDVVVKPSMLVTLPSAVSAGKSVAYKDFEILFDPNIRVDNGLLFFNFTLQNWSDKVEILRYKANDFIVYDDLGNSYPLDLGSCDVDLPYMDRQIEMEPNELIEFKSSRSWCSSEKQIPAFIGVIPLNTKQIYFHIQQFGAFTDLTFIFDL